jgi:hypothetical protein
MGPETNVLHSAVRFLRDYFEFQVHAYVLSSTQQFSRLPVLAITCNKPGSADAWITIREIRHWLMQCKRIQWRVCSAKNKVKRTKVKCQECNIGLCTTPCFKIYHTKLHFWGATDTKIGKRNTQMLGNITVVITELIFFSSVFLMK